MRLIFIKKILRDGSPCKKCAQVLERMDSDGILDSIDEILTADERDPASKGMQLARKYEVERAPFFVIVDDLGNTKVYDVYFQFRKAVADLQTSTV